MFTSHLTDYSSGQHQGCRWSEKLLPDKKLSLDGASMGARLVLELARRGNVLGVVVSPDPGGFWQGWQIPFFYHSVNLPIKLVRLLPPPMPTLTASAIGRTLLFAQFSARP